MSDSIKVLVFGTTPPCTCGRCLQAERQAQLAAKLFPPGEVTVEKHDAISAIGKENHICVTPTIIVAGRKVAVGKVLAADEIARIIAVLLGRNGAETTQTECLGGART